MRDDLTLCPWDVRYTGPAIHDDFLESVFFLGNGRMGVRGYLPWDREELPVQTGLYLAGMFGELTPGITDFVNLPTPVMERIFVDESAAHPVSPIRRALDLKNGVMEIHVSLAAAGKKVDLSYQRFFPKERTGLCLQRTILRAKEPMTVTVESGVMLSSCNCPVPDDQTKDNAETVQLSTLMAAGETDGGFSCAFELAGTGLTLEETILFSSLAEAPLAQSADALTLSFGGVLAAGEEFVLDKLTHIRTGRDVDPRIGDVPAVWSYDTLLAEHKAAWAAQWERCDMTLEGEDLQCALRYAMFQLFCSCSAKDPTVSIGARGLTHGRYKGCYFWDADFFMLPFFLSANPEAARSLCEYRVRALPAAKAHAKKMNATGARYPWMAAFDGSEQCETWDIGCSEVHVTADVVYALDNYCAIAQDEEFYLDRVAEVYIETARFWASRYTYHSESDTADLLFCKGPDEYCGVTNNNLFTNVMVQHNLDLACRAAVDLRKKRPELYRSLGITENETSQWAHLRTIIPWPRNPSTGRLTADDTFHLLEPVEISDLKPTDEASYHWVCFDRLQRYKVVKQADVLLLMTRFPDLFSEQERRDAWEDFEPICLHDSTLSFASHALFAARNGIEDRAWEYARKALLLDLRDLMGNTGREGLHLACMGEVWQAICQLLSHPTEPAERVATATLQKRAVILDLDGVICSTDKYHYQAWKALADRLGVFFDEEINDRLRGVSRMASLEIILEQSDKVCTQAEKEAFAEEKDRTYRQLLMAMTPADLSAEIRDTLVELRRRKYLLAIGSSSKNTKLILERVGLGNFFDAVADGTDITRSKPDPEVFLCAAAKLGVDPADCVVVEDAKAGIQAAKAAGMTALLIGRKGTKGCGLEDYALSSFDELLYLFPNLN